MSADANRMKKLIILGLLPVGLCVVVLLACVGRYYLFESPQRRALPWGASNIHEHYWSDGLLPDYSYHLRADITRDQFLEYAERLDLSPHDPQGDPHDYSWHWNAPARWWTPPQTMERVYSETYRRGGTYIGYYNGQVFVYSFHM